MSSSLAAAQHLKKVDLLLEDSAINFLRPCLSSLSHSQSLQDLFVQCNASGVFSGCAAHTCMHSHTHAQTPHACTYCTYHMPTRQVRACSVNQQTPPTHATVFLYACTTHKTQAYTHTHTHSHANTIFLLNSFTTIPSTYMHNHIHMDAQTRV